MNRGSLKSEPLRISRVPADGSEAIERSGANLKPIAIRLIFLALVILVLLESIMLANLFPRDFGAVETITVLLGGIVWTIWMRHYFGKQNHTVTGK